VRVQIFTRPWIMLKNIVAAVSVSKSCRSSPVLTPAEMISFKRLRYLEMKFRGSLVELVVAEANDFCIIWKENPFCLILGR